MDRADTEPLTVEEAKGQLRVAADGLSLSALVRRHPFGTLAAAFAAGALLSQGPVLRLLLSGGRWSHLASLAASGGAALAKQYAAQEPEQLDYVEGEVVEEPGTTKR